MRAQCNAGNHEALVFRLRKLKAITAFGVILLYLDSKILNLSLAGDLNIYQNISGRQSIHLIQLVYRFGTLVRSIQS